MVLGLLGSYDSDDSGSEDKSCPAAPAVGLSPPAVSQVRQATAQSPAQRPAPGAETARAQLRVSDPQAVAKPISRTSLAAGAPEAATFGRHTSACDCEECAGLLARFVAKNVQTKGIRFRCKLCGDLLVKKADAADHMQDSHSGELQGFKLQKQPKLFQAVKKLTAGEAAKKISFARDDVLGRKRKIDDVEVSFGGWAKKEKPEPPPCEQEGYQEMMQQEVFTAPPWLNQPVPLSNDTDSTDTEKVVDQHVTQAQVKRFTGRNVLEVKKDVVRCKLCYKTFGSVAETEKHIFDAHSEEFSKEQLIWHRFLYASSKRQPPFGWVCKICNLFFPTDNSTWRHLGKEVFIRREQRHADQWKEKEDRWGHEEDEECCGDGMNVANGLSWESVLKIQEQHRQEQAREQEASARANAPGDDERESSESDQDAVASAGAIQAKQFIKEF